MPSCLAMPPSIAEVYLDFDWDRRQVWAMDIRAEIVERRVLDWHLDLPFWSTRPPAPLFDLVPRRVMDDASVSAIHARRIAQADLDFALDVMEHRGRLCIMDGIHRLARAAGERRGTISVRRIPRSGVAMR